LVGVLPQGLPPSPTPTALLVLLSGDGHEPHWQFDVMADVTHRIALPGAAERLLRASHPQEIVDLLSKPNAEPTAGSTMTAAVAGYGVRDQPAGSSVGIAPGVSSGGVAPVQPQPWVVPQNWSGPGGQS
jgi:hypothetical protein